MRLAEFAANSITTDYEYRKGRALGALGGALYRAGRFADAIRRLEEGIGAARETAGRKTGPSWHWLITAWAIAPRRPVGSIGFVPRGLSTSRKGLAGIVIQRLRSEAEAVILYDPAFPKDPFAH